MDRRFCRVDICEPDEDTAYTMLLGLKGDKNHQNPEISLAELESLRMDSEEKLIKNRNKTFGNRLYPKDSHYYIANLQSVDVVYVDEGSIINGTYVNDKAHVYQPLECK